MNCSDRLKTDKRLAIPHPMNIFFLSMSPTEAARFHANIHVVKMIATRITWSRVQQLHLAQVETAQLLCNVHHRARELCDPPYTSKRHSHELFLKGNPLVGSK